MSEKQFCVIGNPIAHSRSPDIHQLFAQQFGHSLSYTRQLATMDTFASTVTGLFRNGLAGANVTVPFKLAAFELASSHSAAALSAQAVNTLIPQADGSLLGANTDGLGLIHDLLRQNCTLKGKRLLLLGAGGAARGVIHNLLEQQPEVIWIYNRTTSKAQQLAQQDERLQAVEAWSDVAAVDGIINATSASLSGQVVPIPEPLLANLEFGYDMMYGTEPTAFMQWLQSRSNAFISDGLGMLVGQAAESYRLWWHSELPSIEPVVTEIRRRLAER